MQVATGSKTFCSLGPFFEIEYHNKKLMATDPETPPAMKFPARKKTDVVMNLILMTVAIRYLNQPRYTLRTEVGADLRPWRLPANFVKNLVAFPGCMALCCVVLGSEYQNVLSVRHCESRFVRPAC